MGQADRNTRAHRNRVSKPCTKKLSQMRAVCAVGMLGNENRLRNQLCVYLHANRNRSIKRASEMHFHTFAR
jgi:hypothetical protein